MERLEPNPRNLRQNTKPDQLVHHCGALPDNDYLEKRLYGLSLSLKMPSLPSRGTSSRLVANKHFIENMAPQSSISLKKVEFEPLDGATSDCHLKAEETLFSLLSI